MLAVLRALVNADAPTWGLQVCKRAKRSTGSVYPLLGRLEQAGIVRSAWDETDRPGARRRLYDLTVSGRGWALEQLRGAADVAQPATASPVPGDAVTGDAR